MNDDQSQRLTRALRQAASDDFDIDVAGLAALAGYSPGHFQRVFRRHFGISPGRFLRHGRIDRFAALLRRGMAVTDAALEAGFGSSSRAFEAARDGLGMSPSRLARGGRGETLHYGTAALSLGRVLVAATPKGLCAVLLGDRDESLMEDLQHRFPRAKLEPAGDPFRSTLNDVVALIDRSSTARPIPDLDLRGTIFQRKVWNALQDIPPGRTITYGDLARQVGLPGGARAVAQACGANPAAVIVPCHRVVAADGGLGGYRWGIERKRALLAQEERDA
ncbi:MAG: methylated-DNA--[protein]-cysteine S-methyltransferase [Gammaproteobacteria bacterium]|jgi:AraC family transcriptional regulator of adaptative response/methylated-DNA-[protein]-cysteine methyltransferase|nr:methylated-DNA--[protein]-cysteine S-methyltransferase [Gammaproteobacteria bacterium]NBD95453.1 methylated-DNA--[protein]-cysteine S-methyltransferase [Gammaproteobacteria bacterium]